MGPAKRSLRLLALVWVLVLVMPGCSKLKDVEVLNRCADAVVLDLWETPTPRAAERKVPTRVQVDAGSRVVAKDALADVDRNGSSAEVVSGSRAGEVIIIPHGGKLNVTIC